MTRRKIVSVVAGALGVAVVLVWWAHVRSRSNELAELKRMLPGAEVLKDEQLVEQPSLLRLSVIRTWVYSIDGQQRSQLLARCQVLEKQIPKPVRDLDPGCLAAIHADPGSYRSASLTVRAQTAEISALYLSSSDYASSYEHK